MLLKVGQHMTLVMLLSTLKCSRTRLPLSELCHSYLSNRENVIASVLHVVLHVAFAVDSVLCQQFQLAFEVELAECVLPLLCRTVFKILIIFNHEICILWLGF
ncbi:unnamed protein product [Ceratitis capitata]|uniref:(Mediterranean fruit fly) hypothetical protein n=1 Tax=Ceratitis capitata TaxID=7213 RepID=A0A811USF9_CERCA|nr:unnamed protein product [Ceratitis capitata]